MAQSKKEVLLERRLCDEPKLDDLATKCEPSLFSDTLYMKSYMYFWIMLLSGIFYILPAMQLVIGGQRLPYQTGSLDLCYYNFLCRPKSGFFHDYGHVFSNVGYIFCGLYFILLVFLNLAVIIFLLSNPLPITKCVLLFPKGIVDD